MTLDYLQLLDSEPIFIDGIGHIVPPTIRSIKKIGLKSYYSKLGILQISPKDIVKENAFEMFPNIDMDNLHIFDVMLFDKGFLQMLRDSLSFFVTEKICLSERGASFVCCDREANEIVGEINRNNFNELCSLILQLNFLETKSLEKLKPKNKEAERILKKLQGAPQKDSGNKSQSIGEMVAAICANVDTYKYSDMWSLTVYQLYDLFFRLKLRKQIDISAQRWAASWSSEPFDFDLWCKNIK